MASELHDSVNDFEKRIAQDNETVNLPPPRPEEKKEPEPEEETTGNPGSNTSLNEEQAEASTDMALAILDNANRLIFTTLANKKLKRRAAEIDPENGFSRLKQLRAEISANSGKKNGVEVVNNYTGKDAALLHVDSVVEEFINSLPFNEQEIAMMRPGLKVMVEKNMGKLPPEVFFYAGLLTTVGGNTAEYFNI